MLRFLLPASFGAFLLGNFISCAIFANGEPFDPKTAILSDLQSPDDNPKGYLAAAAGTAISAVLLMPAMVLCYGRVRNERPTLALAGLMGVEAGLLSALTIGILAPFTHDYSALHIQLASATFIGVSAGSWLLLLAARASPAFIGFQLGALLAVVFLCLGPVVFNNARLLTSLAFWEWVLCADCGVAIWVLARRLRLE
ncbi:MAG: hypothetical protein K2X03_17930 [Bryobacteraceae bacterium]|nr:hypothetical protein [Bryobacteraceae bacterium]